MMPSAFPSIKGSLLRNVELAPYVSYKVGGPADYFLKITSEEDWPLVFNWINQYKIPFFILGCGSNILVGDKGFRGAVLYLGSDLEEEIKILNETPQEILLDVPASWPKARLLDWSINHSYSGLEFSAGIPGTLGGAVFMNAGTKWGSYGDIIESVKLFHPTQGWIVKSKEDMGFRYRGLGEGALDASLIYRVRIKLSKLKSQNEILKLCDEILSYRGLRQPLTLANCGSVFKNPPEGPGAGRLIEACALKGKKIGGAQVSELHANFILNTGKATAHDLKNLMEFIAGEVKKQKGVELHREVIFVGEF